MTDSLIKRLRHDAGPIPGNIPAAHQRALLDMDALMNEAADRIAALEATVQERDRRISEVTGNNVDLRRLVEKLDAELFGSRANGAAMRKALERIDRHKQLFEGTWLGDVVSQALTTDAGKDVLAVVEAARDLANATVGNADTSIIFMDELNALFGTLSALDGSKTDG